MKIQKYQNKAFFVKDENNWKYNGEAVEFQNGVVNIADVMEYKASTGPIKIREISFKADSVGESNRVNDVMMALNSRSISGNVIDGDEVTDENVAKVIDKMGDAPHFAISHKNYRQIMEKKPPSVIASVKEKGSVEGDIESHMSTMGQNILYKIDIEKEIRSEVIDKIHFKK